MLRVCLCGILLLSMLLTAPAGGRPARAEYTDETGRTQEEVLKERAAENSFTKTVSLLGRNYVVYAQNSPEWAMIRVDKGKSNMRDSMCCAVVLANLLVNCVPYGELSRISSLAPRPIQLDTVNLCWRMGNKPEYKFTVTEEADFFRFYPLCVGNLMTGNNHRKGDYFQTRFLYDAALEACGLTFEKTKDLERCIDAVAQGAVAAVCSGGRASPIAPEGGHYLVLAAADDEELYFLDSQFREAYKADVRRIIRVMEPGVFAVKREKLRYLMLTGENVIVHPREDCTEYTAERLAEIIAESYALRAGQPAGAEP